MLCFNLLLRILVFTITSANLYCSNNLCLLEHRQKTRIEPCSLWKMITTLFSASTLLSSHNSSWTITVDLLCSVSTRLWSLLLMIASHSVSLRISRSRYLRYHRTSFFCSIYWLSSRGCLLTSIVLASESPSSVHREARRYQRCRYWCHACNIVFSEDMRNMRVFRYTTDVCRNTR